MSLPFTQISPELARGLSLGAPVVALESTVITHGLPHPQNIQLARDMEAAVRQPRALPATIALLTGEIRIGLSDAELSQLATDPSPLKISQRDFATALVQRANGGTTVAATMFAAQRAGIEVFATGGIGGVHLESPFDISTDLHALAEIPMLVVCAGAKAILDLPATVEYLETMGVPVVGYQTSEFPAFYSRESGLKVSVRLEDSQEIVEFARAHWRLGMRSAVLVANPIPQQNAIPRSEMDPWVAKAAAEAEARHIHGQALTPFLLARISELSDGQSVRSNLALLLTNARLAAGLAMETKSVRP